MSTQPHETILAKVNEARWRLILAAFGRTLNASLFVALIVSTMAIAAIAVVPLKEITNAVGITSDAAGGGVTPGQWIAGWLLVTIGLAFLIAAARAGLRAPTRAVAAAEVDRRFGLQERLSSALALGTPAAQSGVSSDCRSSQFADALQADAARRAESLSIGDQFPLAINRASWLPLSIIPILAVMILVVKPAVPAGHQIAATIDSSEVRQVKAVTAELKKRLAQQRRAAAAKGLTEAQEMFEQMERQLDQITASKSLNRKDALIQLNEIKDQIQERKDSIGSPEQLKRTLSQMKGLGGGPAEKIANQIKQGDFGKAAEEIRKLADQLEQGQLDEQEKQQLAAQAKQLAKQMQAAVQQHEQQKADLQEQIEQAKREGRSEDAAKLQQQLNQTQAADAQMQQLQQMAESMQQAADATQQGDTQAAADALQQMSEEFGEMQAAMEQLEDLQSALDDLSQSKDQMNCQQCNGAGCQHCAGNGLGQGDHPGSGAGIGRGKGPRTADPADEQSDTNSYDAQVRGDIQRGRAVIAGFADGPNSKGVTRETIKSAIESSINKQSDPLEDQVLPRDEREQTRQYFDRLREDS